MRDLRSSPDAVVNVIHSSIQGTGISQAFYFIFLSPLAGDKKYCALLRRRSHEHDSTPCIRRLAEIIASHGKYMTREGPVLCFDRGFVRSSCVPQRVCSPCKHILELEDWREVIEWRLERVYSYLEGRLIDHFDSSVVRTSALWHSLRPLRDRQLFLPPEDEVPPMSKWPNGPC